MTDVPGLFCVLDAADGKRDGDFVRALAELVDAGRIILEPDVEYDVPFGDAFAANLTWGFSVPEGWLAAWMRGPEGDGT